MKLEVKNLSCVRGNTYLFRNLNFNLAAGQLLWVQGQNGTGKSSLLKILAGLMLPEKGSVFWQGQTIDNLGAMYYAIMSYLGHKDGLKRILTPNQNIKHHITLGQSEVTELEMDKMLELLGLRSHAQTPSQELSVGQRRKVALAALMLKQKPLWILDEPFTALDTQSVKIIKNRINHHLSQGAIVIMASHTSVEEYGQSVLNLSPENMC